MKNYEFELIAENNLMFLHMMDRAEKYLNRICEPQALDAPQIHIHGPEGMPPELVGMIENALHNKFAQNFKPREELQGVVSIRLHNTYTIAFDLAKLWYEQKLLDVQDQIINMMGLESDYLEIDWAEKQWQELKSGEKSDPEEN